MESHAIVESAYRTTPLKTAGMRLGIPYIIGNEAAERFRWEDAARRLTVEPDARMKKWPGAAREFLVEVIGSDAPRKRITFGGQRVIVKL